MTLIELVQEHGEAALLQYMHEVSQAGLDISGKYNLEPNLLLIVWDKDKPQGPQVFLAGAGGMPAKDEVSVLLQHVELAIQNQP